MNRNKKIPEKTKPFITGSPSDENTLRNALKFFGLLALSMFMTFLVCSMTGVGSVVLRILINTVIEVLILLIFFNRGTDQGTDAVARGEILYQHIEKGQEVSASERRIPFHKMKGFLIGLAGSSVILVLAAIFAFTAQKQMTGAGTLPSWMEGFLRRTEVGDALVQYTQTAGLSAADALRLIMRIAIMPFISMAGPENTDLILLLERISPLLVCLPGLSFGLGYLQGPARRKQVHTEIAQNTRKRISKEKKERKARAARVPKGPEQLN